MIAARIIEYLAALSRPGGGRLCSHEAIQVLIPIFPPNTTLPVSFGPLGGDYGQILYGARLGPNMVPNAFEGFLQIWGTRQISGTFTSGVLNTEIQGFNWVTKAEPVNVYISNVSGLNQVFELEYVSLRITSEDDLSLVVDHINHMATSARSEELAEECRDLLKTIAGVH